MDYTAVYYDKNLKVISYENLKDLEIFINQNKSSKLKYVLSVNLDLNLFN